MDIEKLKVISKKANTRFGQEQHRSINVTVDRDVTAVNILGCMAIKDRTDDTRVVELFQHGWQSFVEIPEESFKDEILVPWLDSLQPAPDLSKRSRFELCVSREAAARMVLNDELEVTALKNTEERRGLGSSSFSHGVDSYSPGPTEGAVCDIEIHEEIIPMTIWMDNLFWKKFNLANSRPKMQSKMTPFILRNW